MALMTPVSRILSISALVTLAFVYSSITSGRIKHWDPSLLNLQSLIPGSRHLSVGLNVSGKEGSRIKSQAGRAKTTPAAFLPPRMPRPSGMPRRQYLRNLGAATLSIAGILRGRDKANAIGTSKDFTVPVHRTPTRFELPNTIISKMERVYLKIIITCIKKRIGVKLWDMYISFWTPLGGDPELRGNAVP
eukprot:1385390-Amorphochlora_amoeboformis.AAC.1